MSRADSISIGDYIAVQDHNDNSVIVRVSSIEEVGDDVTFNDRITTSAGNLVVRLGKSFVVVSS
jgi:hypothetical protein